ncbi:CPBP family intramembrane glutamic endopeptidase [Bombilactobacillus bombi]|uniref:CPBP family intramembrane glutamic endopeptidase n=1 Tax=Bombilactobacillus bombi TaxID=1303590 RepID=UPI0035EFDA6D
MKNKTEKDQQALTIKILLVPVLIIIAQLPTMFLTSKFKEPYWKTILVIIVSALVISFFIWILQKVQRFITKKLNAQAWLMIIIATSFIVIINKILLPFFQTTGNANVKAQLRVLHSTPVLFIIYALVVAPVIEELLFRGYLINVLFSHTSHRSVLISHTNYLGMVCSAAIFGLLHISTDPIYFFSKFILGILLGIVYEKTKNIKASIIVHLLNNWLALII